MTAGHEVWRGGTWLVALGPCDSTILACLSFVFVSVVRSSLSCKRPEHRDSGGSHKSSLKRQTSQTQTTA